MFSNHHVADSSSKMTILRDTVAKQAYLHVMTVHEAMYNLLKEEARLGLSKALALPYIIQQGSSLCQLLHL